MQRQYSEEKASERRTERAKRATACSQRVRPVLVVVVVVVLARQAVSMSISTSLASTGGRPGCQGPRKPHSGPIGNPNPKPHSHSHQGSSRKQQSSNSEEEIAQRSVIHTGLSCHFFWGVCF